VTRGGPPNKLHPHRVTHRFNPGGSQVHLRQGVSPLKQFRHSKLV
jgi:hypothetical protein